MAGPIAPKTIKALILHVADVADATLNREILRAANFLIQTCTGEDFQLTTAKEAFDIISAKQSHGCDGVLATLNKIHKRKMTFFLRY